MSRRKFYPGDRVVLEETSLAPGQSDLCIIEHFMTVRESCERGTLVLLTGKGDMHITHNNNPQVRRASFWERMRYRSRFPRFTSVMG